MKGLLKITGIFMIACFLLPLSFSYAADINTLVDQFKQATDLQRQQILKDNFASDISASGIVSNVEEYNYFKEKTDTLKKYYRISTQTQNTPQDTPYEVVFLYKNESEVKDIPKGERLEAAGKIIKIVDERLQITVWIFSGELTEQEKDLFKQDLSL